MRPWKCCKLEGSWLGLRSWDAREGPQPRLYSVKAQPCCYILSLPRGSRGLGRRTAYIQSLYDMVMRETANYPYWDSSEPAQRHSSKHLKNLKDRGLWRLVAAVGQRSYLHCDFRFLGWVPPLPYISCLCPSLTLHKKQYLQADGLHATSATVHTSHFQILHPLWSPLHVTIGSALQWSLGFFWEGCCVVWFGVFFS